MILDQDKQDLMLAVKRLLAVLKGHPADRTYCISESEKLLERLNNDSKTSA